MNFFLILKNGIRKKAWIKNILIFYPLFFNLTSENFYTSLSLFFTFSFLASAVYVFNDFFDKGSDSLHPVKKYRVQILNTFKPSDIIVSIIILLSLSMTFFWPVFSWNAMMLVSLYCGVNILYTLKFKFVKWLDVICLTFFLMSRILFSSSILKHELHIGEIVFFSMAFFFLGLLKRRRECSCLLNIMFHLIS